MGVKFEALKVMFEMQKIRAVCIYLFIFNLSLFVFQPYILTPFISISHILLIFKPIPMIFVRLHASRKGLQNLFIVQRPSTNVEKVIKLYLQRFFTYLFTLPY